MTDGEVLCCPHCCSSSIRSYNERESPIQHDEEWGCKDCGERFNDPDTRPPKGEQVVRPDSAAGKLDRMDPSDLDDLLDGGAA